MPRQKTTRSWRKSLFYLLSAAWWRLTPPGPLFVFAGARIHPDHRLPAAASVTEEALQVRMEVGGSHRHSSGRVLASGG